MVVTRMSYSGNSSMTRNLDALSSLGQGKLRCLGSNSTMDKPTLLQKRGIFLK